MRNSSCFFRCSRWTATALAGRDTVRRPAAVLGALKRRPALVCSSARSIRMDAPVQVYAGPGQGQQLATPTAGGQRRGAESH
jgi:hypothetical protein